MGVRYGVVNLFGVFSLGGNIDRLPRWQIMGQQTPRTVTAQNIENRIQELPHRMHPRPATRLGFGQMWLENGPLSIGDICRIWLSIHSPYKRTMVGAMHHFSDGF